MSPQLPERNRNDSEVADTICPQNRGTKHDHKVTISYSVALAIQSTVCNEILGESSNLEHEAVSVLDVPGRRLAMDICASTDNPPYDTSAMDGFAVDSAKSENASPTNPVRFVVRGLIAAGGAPPAVDCATSKDGTPVCFEIMTGARFPYPDALDDFDACVKIEDTTTFIDRLGERIIEIREPLRRFQNRRRRGEDYSCGDVLLHKGREMNDSSHIMALASLGISQVLVERCLKAAVIITGSELQPHDDGLPLMDNHIRNSNGPLVLSMLRSQSIETLYHGIVQDEPTSKLRSALAQALRQEPEVILTTGAVSVGKLDHVLEQAKGLGLEVHYHGVQMRPGHPVLFGSFPPSHSRKKRIAFFGLPGNPLATAVCMRFLVIPFLQSLHGIPSNEAKKAVFDGVLSSDGSIEPRNRRKPAHIQSFWHARSWIDRDQVLRAAVSPDQGSGKVRPFMSANCWIAAPGGIESVDVGNYVQVHDLNV